MRRSLTASTLAVFVTCAAVFAEPGDPARLVSRDAVVYVQAPSITALETSLRSIVGAVDPEQAKMIDVRAMLLADFGGEIAPDMIDATKPIGFAVSIAPKTMQPVMTVIVAARSVDELVKAFAAAHTPVPTETDGEFVAWHSAPPATPALASEPNPLPFLYKLIRRSLKRTQRKKRHPKKNTKEKQSRRKEDYQTLRT